MELPQAQVSGVCEPSLSYPYRPVQPISIHTAAVAQLTTQNHPVNIASLSVPQLRALQSRLTSELEHLTNSHAKLRAAQSKFRDSIRSVNDGVIGSEKKGTDGRDEILVPLTSSLYVKGRLTERGKVLVDVGTGFYVEKVRIFTTFQGAIWWCLVDCRRLICFAD